MGTQRKKKKAAGLDPGRAIKTEVGGPIPQRALRLMRLGLSDAQVVAVLRDEFPGARTSHSGVDWYRWKFHRDGHLEHRLWQPPAGRAAKSAA